MTALVRCFSYGGVVSVPVANQALQASDKEFLLLKQPYMANETLSVAGSAVSSSAGLAPAGTVCLAVEIETGKTVGYEVTTENGAARTATTDSPRLEGRNIIQFGAGWSLSLIEIT